MKSPIKESDNRALNWFENRQLPLLNHWGQANAFPLIILENFPSCNNFKASQAKEIGHTTGSAGGCGRIFIQHKE